MLLLCVFASVRVGSGRSRSGPRSAACPAFPVDRKLENLSKGGMVWEQTVYRKGFLHLPAILHAIAASAVKAPRIPLASSNELTNDRGSSPLAAKVTVIPVTQAPRLAIPLASSNELTRMSVQVGSSCEDNTTWHFLPSCMLVQL